MDQKFDELLNQLGTGPWNLLIIISAAYWMFVVPFHAFGGAFLAPQVNHTCILPPEALVSTDDLQGTFNETKDDACWYSARNTDGNVDVFPCTNWEFDNSTYSSTLTSEFQLVCDRNYMRPTFQSIYYFAGIIGSPMNGFLSDKYGRKTTIFISSFIYTIMALSVSWLKDFSAIMVIRFIMGIVNPAAIHTNFTIALEVCEPKHRALVGMLVFLPWACSMMAWGGMGYLIRDWRWLQFAVALPPLLYLPMICIADESPRWLIVRGYHDRAVKVLQRAARWNKATIPPERELRSLMKAIQYEGNAGTANSRDRSNGVIHMLRRMVESVIILFKTRKIRKLTISMYCMYLVLGTVYFGLSLGGENFGSNPFLYMVLTGLVEIPGATITIPLIQNFGRRLPNAMCFMVTGVSLLILPFIPTSVEWFSTTLVMIGKLAISAAYQIAFLLASEVFPTEVRLRGLGTASTIAVGGISAAPYIVNVLGELYRWLPSVVFGVGGIVAGIITFTVPEPLGVALPDTVAALEAGALSKKKKKVEKSTQQNYQQMKVLTVD